MKKAGTALMCVVVLVAGCADMQRRTAWSKSGAAPGERESTMAECDYQAIKHGGDGDPSMSAIGQGIEIGMRRNQIFAACMKAKGWW